MRVVRPQANEATCNADEVMISAYCKGDFRRYPLIPTDNGARCAPGRNNVTVQVTLVCAKL
jgi:hypothetical protein